ncbi:zinc-finger of the MIZ type in Nse subunit-domain-containing protein [Cryomyces antarcticus]
MPSAQRQSTAGTSTQRRGNAVEFPPYEHLSHPLNVSAQRALANLRSTHSLAKLQKQLDYAGESVTSSAGEINDRLASKLEHVRKRKAKRQQQGLEDDEEQEEKERNVEELQSKVEGMTQRMDANLRKVIDGQHALQRLDMTLQEIVANAATQATPRTTQQPMQGTQRRRRQHLGADGEEEDEDYEDFEPTDPGATASQAPATIDLFRQKVQRDKDKYQSLSLGTRYSEHNTYVNFRKLVHDAQHGEDGPPLPHASTWFTDGAAPAPGITTRSGAGAAENDSDDDIAIARERISTECPLTLKEFEEPLTSRKCPHSFEKNAIMQMIAQSSARTGGSNRRGARDGEQVVQCPVPGCKEMLTAGDLHTDPLLLRKIRRIQQSRLDEDESYSDVEVPGTQRRAEEIVSGSEDDAAASRRRTKRLKSVAPKIERKSGVVAATPRGTQRPSRSSGVVVDLGVSDDEEMG